MLCTSQYIKMYWTLTDMIEYLFCIQNIYRLANILKYILSILDPDRYDRIFI